MLCYKKIILTPLFICLLFSFYQFNSNAQDVPNGSFEAWVIGEGPDLWFTNNIYWPPFQCKQIYPDFLPYSGNICAQGVVDSCVEFFSLRPPVLTSFNISLDAKPEALHGFYKYFPKDDDLFSASIKIFSQNVLIGEGIFKSNKLVPDFNKFIIDIEYSTSDTPDVAVIEITIDSSLTDNQLHRWSMWFIDSLNFGPLSDIFDDNDGRHLNFQLAQNYPNPFNPLTTIKYRIPSVISTGGRNLKVTLKVFDVLGKEHTTLVNGEKPAGTYEITWYAENLPSGVYFYQLRAGKYIETKKMLLIK